MSFFAWFPSLRAFIKREWSAAFAGCSVGTGAAFLVRLLISDSHSGSLLSEEYAPIKSHWDGPGAYLTCIIALGTALLLFLAPKLFTLSTRWGRSWRDGVTTGMFFLPFVTSALVFGLLPGRALILAPLDVGLICLIFALGWRRSNLAYERSEQRLQPSQVQVEISHLQKAGTRFSESDEPIRSWDEDALERGQIVNSILFSLLISRNPVMGLFGEFGSGKTSILNLLASELKRYAIVVSFSPWLSGSAEALTSQLLGDIARECNKQYLVPGLRNDARRLARALAKSVAILNGVSDFLSETTQSEEINRMDRSLSRLPKSVVVLLDEVDRMQKEEILTLLKVIRGLRYPLNLTFLVASDRSTIERAVFDGQYGHDSNTYFEKFFPASIRVPAMDADALKSLGIQRIMSSLHTRDWFSIEEDEAKFKEKLEERWNNLFAPFCKTLRSVGLLANDLGVAASPLKDEVSPLELTLVELLRRFEPSAYDVVWRHQDTLTGGVGMLSKNYVYRSDSKKAELRKSLLDELNRSIEDGERREAVFGILRVLFPLFSEIEGKSSARVGDQSDTSEEYKHISDPRLIAAYFRYKLPEDIFSAKQLNTFTGEFARTPDDRAGYELFAHTLDSMEKGSALRNSFLERLSDKVQDKNFDLELASKIARITMLGASKYLYDSFMVSFGEAGHALRIVIRVALRLPQDKRASFLSECISLATDDTMAFRIQVILTKPGSDFVLNVSFNELYPSFIMRMRRLYGEDVNAHDMSLSTSDPEAFNLWGISDLSREEVKVDPEDRRIQYSFWLRYIGENRTLLARAFGAFFMPNAIYREDPSGYVENKIPVSDLRSLYERLPDDGSLTDEDRKSLRRLKRLLDGKFKNGTGSPFDADESADDEQES